MNDLEEPEEFSVGDVAWIIYETVVVRCRITEVDDYFRQQDPQAYLFYVVDEPIGHSLAADELFPSAREAMETLRMEYTAWVEEDHKCPAEVCQKMVTRYRTDTLDSIRRSRAEFIGTTHEGDTPSATQKFADDLLKRYPAKIEGKDWFRIG
jgi:hypothetical protein